MNILNEASPMRAPAKEGTNQSMIHNDNYQIGKIKFENAYWFGRLRLKITFAIIGEPTCIALSNCSSMPLNGAGTCWPPTHQHLVHQQRDGPLALIACQ